MTTYNISSPYASFADTDGSPLNAGYVYIGTANLNPETNPLSIYWDSGLTIPAAQPLRTSNGFIVRNGTPAAVYVASDFSINVRNSSGALLYTSSTNPNVSGIATILGDLANSSNVSKGDALVAMKQPVVGAVARTVHDKLAEIVSIQDFGGVGDNSTDNTAAFNLAIAYMAATGYDVFIPPGIYLTDPITINAQSYSIQSSFIGVDKERSIIKRRTTGASAFVTFGGLASTSFQVGIALKNLTLDGGATTNGNTFVGYDIVRSTFENVRFKGGDIACHLNGGISVTFLNCTWDLATYGLKIEKFTSAAGGGWPNLIRILGGEVVDNSTYGIWFDHGRLLVLRDVDIEGNGTTLAASEGGVYIGSNVGTEVTVSDTFSIGLIADGCWLEANKGVADINLNSGINSISDCNFFSQSTEVTNDIKINAGKYYVKNVNCSFSKAANILEHASGTEIGNLIEFSDVPNISYVASKTSVWGSNKINARDGIVPIVYGLNTPYIVTGNTNTGASGTSISFPVTFASAPKVFITVSNGDTTTIINQAVVSSITTTGFFIRGLALTSGSSTVTQSNIGVNWYAIGTL